MSACEICDIGMFSEAETITAIDKIRKLRARVSVVGYELTDDELAERVNIKYFEEYCFCEVKSKDEDVRFQEGKERVVSFYTNNLFAVTVLISDVYGHWHSITETREEPIKTYKVEIPYRDLLRFILDCLDCELQSLTDWLDEMEG